jgi:transcription termination/antitermination protein NusG
MIDVPEPHTATVTPRAPSDLLPDRRRDTDRRWFVLHTRARQEKALVSSLYGIGLISYLPLRRNERRHGSRVVTSTVPVFPGYVFLWGSRGESYLADRTRRVATVIEVADQDRLEWELTNLHRALATGRPLEACPVERGGVRVRVVSGPLAGVEGIVADRNAPDRLIVQVLVLNAAASLDIRDELAVPLGI